MANDDRSATIGARSARRLLTAATTSSRHDRCERRGSFDPQLHACCHGLQRRAACDKDVSTKEKSMEARFARVVSRVGPLVGWLCWLVADLPLPMLRPVTRRRISRSPRRRRSWPRRSATRPRSGASKLADRMARQRDAAVVEAVPDSCERRANRRRRGDELCVRSRRSVQLGA